MTHYIPGIYFIIIGSIFSFLSYQYSFGSFYRIDTGAIPFILSITLIFIGLFCLKTSDANIRKIDMHSIFYVLLSIFTFCFFTFFLNLYFGLFFMILVYLYGFRNI